MSTTPTTSDAMFKSQKFQDLLSSALSSASLDLPDMWASGDDLLIESWRVINACVDQDVLWAKEAMMAVLAALWKDDALADKCALRAVQLFDGEKKETHFAEFIRKTSTSPYRGSSTPHRGKYLPFSGGEPYQNTTAYLLPSLGACRRCRNSTCPVGPNGYCKYCRDEDQSYG